MQFGAMVVPRASDWVLIKELEEMGYHSVWTPDSQMIYSDTYAILALAAANTSRIRLGTGVSIAPTRLAPVTAHSIATVNQLAPGRTFLALGTGHTAMRVMGMEPMKVAEFREYLRVVRSLLHGQEVEFTLNGRTREIKFLHQNNGFINVADPVPIYVAADGPKALNAVGAYGDGRICSHNQTKALLQDSLSKIEIGAREGGRELTSEFHVAALTYGCVLRPGESFISDRVIDEVGAMALAALHYWWEMYQQTGDTSTIARSCQNLWDEYLTFTQGLEIPLEKRYQQIHMGHCTFTLSEERHFVTENLIKATGGLVGTPDEILAMLREREEMGLKEVALLPSMSQARSNFQDFADLVISKY
ncbi:MAG: hypothetical protein CMM58_06595 [Rhodospirillaceae bacterium]|nr:hypothetical protein [Rhodospirillaceae bacterium]|tara:strand:- start:409 stop:1491 length:1083 start_codon:yes stop_codon:yes gene_type:complete